jgi:2-haloacid dehalogenase
VHGLSIDGSASLDVIDRRQFLSGALGAFGTAASASSVRAGTVSENAAASSVPAPTSSTASSMVPSMKNTFDAIAFDGFVVFDPRPVGALAESLVPGRGAALVNAWRARQFDYQWLRALGGQYADFMQTTAAALDFATAQLAIELDAASKQRLTVAYANLPVWPDVATSFARLRESGMRLAMLSNMTHAMLADGLVRGGVGSLVDAILSTDAIATYKPDRRAYGLGADALGVPKERILFAAFAGWDVAGAKWFGYQTFWVNRVRAPAEHLGVAADAGGEDLDALVRFATASDR